MNTLSIGDKVRFLNDVGGGTIVKILRNNQVVVKDENDFEYPVSASEIVVIEKAKENNTIIKDIANTVVENIKENIKNVESIITNKPKIEIKKDTKTDYLFAFVRNYNDDYDGFDCYLINDSNYFIFYNIILFGENGFVKIDSEILEPNTKIIVGQLTREKINYSKEIIIQSILYDNPASTYHEMLERRIKITPIKFFREDSFKENDFLDEKAYIFELLKEDLGLGNSIRTQKEFEQQMAEKDNDAPKQAPQKQKPPEKIEVDLHINQLIDSVVGLSNSEILNIQMETFHKTMTDAISRKARRVVVIHGIGNGTLKANVRKSLEEQYHLPYEDASFR
ncbi:MAG: DUF2027 domain-containing protein, partial [Bacteroidales bacterium]|nr:DUF2027 domain-containing protein [Bacteroidales bacterium]